jgi:hypothetical protein
VRIAPERFDVVGDVVGEWWLWAVVGSSTVAVDGAELPLEV